MRRLLHTCLLAFLLVSIASAQTAQQNPLVIKGQVLDDQGRPVSGAHVIASPDGGLRGRVPSASSDSRGEFSIVVYKPDSYKVSASKPADGYPSSSNPFYYPTEDSLAHVSVLGAGEAPFARVRFGPKAGNIAGRIIDAETGRVVEDFQITLCRAEVPMYCHRQSAKQSGGRFNMLVPAASFTIQISAPGYEDWYGAEREDRQPVSVQVSPGTTRELNVSLSRLSESRERREFRGAEITAAGVAPRWRRARSLSTHNQTRVVGSSGGSQLYGRIRGLPAGNGGKRVSRSTSPTEGEPATFWN